MNALAGGRSPKNKRTRELGDRVRKTQREKSDDGAQERPPPVSRAARLLPRLDRVEVVLTKGVEERLCALAKRAGHAAPRHAGT